MKLLVEDDGFLDDFIRSAPAVLFCGLKVKSSSGFRAYLINKVKQNNIKFNIRCIQKSIYNFIIQQHSKCSVMHMTRSRSPCYFEDYFMGESKL